MKTVNLIEYADEMVMSVRSFTDTTTGNKKAEQCFSRIVKESDPSLDEEEIENCIEEGYYENNGYQLFIVHST